MKRKDAVLAGGPLVHDLENAALDAVRAVAMATVGLIDLQRQANLSPVVGARAWDRLADTTATLHRGLQESLAFHDAMVEVKERMGCRTVDNGGGDKNPPQGQEFFTTGEAPKPLRAVA